MTSVVLQPAGNAASRKHYADTIENPVILSDMEQYLDEPDQRILESIYPSKVVPTWGVTPGKTGQNQKKWNRLEVGDITLFARSGRIVSSGVLTHKLHSADLAARLWNRKEDGSTWEFIYFLDEITPHDIPVGQLNKVVGYKEQNVIQGFTVLDEEKSDAVLNYYELDSSIYFPTVSVEQYNAVLNADSLDASTKSNMRKEQGFLRSNLFGGKKAGECCICGKTYPIQFLITAHIKKRAECTLPERKDYKHIVASMCKFGCDDLYEKHYLYVEDGVIHIAPGKYVTTELKSRLAELDGNQCEAWTDGTSRYFDWHRRCVISGIQR